MALKWLPKPGISKEIPSYEDTSATGECMSQLVKYLDASTTDELVRVLYEQRPTLFSLCKRWSGGNIPDAEDLLGDACLRAFEALSRSTVELESPLGWWATIIANIARDRARQRARRSRVAAELAAVWTRSCAETGAGLDDRLGTRRGLARVSAKMSGLSNTQRLAVTFRCFGDEYDEIADKLGTSNGNARKLVQIGRRLLRSDGGEAAAHRDQAVA
jgi:RNA polymerase sigma factor (sigma-70 family)